MSSDTPSALLLFGEIMRHASVLIHSRNDLPASTVVAEAGVFTGPNQAFEPIINPIYLNDLKVDKVQPMSDDRFVNDHSYNDWVLKHLAFMTCPPENLFVLMSHCNSVAYSEFDKVLIDGLSIDLHFDLDDVMIYPVQDGCIDHGVSYSTYFSGLKS